MARAITGEDVVRALARADGAVVRETHGSWVVLAGSRAWKVKKPVRWDFLDYATLDARRRACREEVRVNAELAPDLYLGVRSVVDRDGALVLGPSDETDDAVEYVVEMRRFDEAATMAALVERGALTAEQVAAVAARIAGFHEAATPYRAPDPVGLLIDRVTRDLDDVDDIDAGVEADAARRFAASIAARHGAEIRQRSDEGWVREGHGDLRAEHVLVDPLAIVDRLEFDVALRRADVADDVAFLAMDLERLDARWAADALLDAYGACGGRLASTGLAATFAWRRAIVRLKVALLARDPTLARGFERLADRLAWRARGPLTLVVCGPPASGKSTIAAALARLLELPVVSSDVVRKGLVGVPPTDRADVSAYADAVSDRVYADLATRARRHVEVEGGVIVDATMRRASRRHELLATLGNDVRWVWCDASVELVAERARRRERDDPSRVSDAGADVAVALARAFEPLDELDPATVCRLAAERGLEEGIAAIAAWLDN